MPRHRIRLVNNATIVFHSDKNGATAARSVQIQPSVSSFDFKSGNNYITAARRRTPRVMEITGGTFASKRMWMAGAPASKSLK